MKLSRPAALLALAFVVAAPVRAADDDLPSPERIAAVREYIKKGWTTLSRSSSDLLRAAPDPKMHPRPRRALAGLRLREGGPGAGGGGPAPHAEAGGDGPDRAAPPARGEGDPPRPALPAAALRRPRRALQRDVRLGQLLHPGRPAARRRGRARPGHGRQLPLRDRALRHDPEREPDLLPDPLAAAVPDPDDPRGLRADRRPRVAALHAARHRPLLPRSGPPRPHLVPPRASRATTTSARARRRRWSATRRTPQGAPTTTGCGSTTAPTRSPTTTCGLLRPRRRTA